MIHIEDFECPRCQKDHSVSFNCYRPNNKDQYTNIVNCECGVKFECTIEAEIRVDFIAYHSEIIA